MRSESQANSDFDRSRDLSCAPVSKRSSPDRLIFERGASAAPALRSEAMQYLLMIRSDEKAMQAAPKDQIETMLGAYGAYTKAMKEAGVYVAGERVHPSSTGAVVRVKNGKSSVLNSPYAEIKEQLGGYYLIEAPDLDQAIAWAARCPGANRRCRGAADLVDVREQGVTAGRDP
jgi:hypothetical protein